jgi:hypothetical protein
MSKKIIDFSKTELEDFLRDLKKIPLLDAEETSELQKDAADGNTEAAVKLFHHNQRLVVYLADKLVDPFDIELQQLLDPGMEALKKAIQSYSNEKTNFPPISRLTLMIRRRLIDFVVRTKFPFLVLAASVESDLSPGEYYAVFFIAQVLDEVLFESTLDLEKITAELLEQELPLRILQQALVVTFSDPALPYFNGKTFINRVPLFQKILELSSPDLHQRFVREN